MESVTLLSIIEDIHRYKLRYCVLCLRTELQRALVSSPSLKILLECLSPKETLQWRFTQEERLVCFVCEARVKTALCVVHSIKFGAKCQKLIEKSVPRGRSVFVFPAAVSHLVTECERSVDKVRMKTAIAVTETLCVATKVTEPAPTSDVIVLEDEPDNVNSTVNVQSNNNEESILPDLPRRTYKPIKPKPITSADNKEKVKSERIYLQNFIKTNTSVKTCNVPNKIAPVNIGNSAVNTGNLAVNTGNLAVNTGNLAVNTGNLAVNTGNLVPIASTASVVNPVSVSPMLNLSNNIDPQSGQMLAVQTHDGSYVFHNILQVDGTQYVPTLGAIIVDGKLQPISNVLNNSATVSNSSKGTVGNEVPLITNVASTATNVARSVANVASKSVTNVSNKNAKYKSRAAPMIPVISNIDKNPLPNNRITDTFMKKLLKENNNVKSLVDEDDVPLKRIKINIKNKDKFGKDDGAVDIKVEECIDLDTIIDGTEQESQILRPKLKDGVNIDWEDKIPMDVISYMDATDPNIKGNMMVEQNNETDSNTNTASPPMGIISSVYSGGECQMATSVLEKILNNDDVISID